MILTRFPERIRVKIIAVEKVFDDLEAALFGEPFDHPNAVFLRNFHKDRFPLRELESLVKCFDINVLRFLAD